MLAVAMVSGTLVVMVFSLLCHQATSNQLYFRVAISGECISHKFVNLVLAHGAAILVDEYKDTIL